MDKSKYLHISLLISLSFIWGSSFILIKKSLLVFNEHEIALLRMTIAWLTLIPLCFKKIFLINKNIIGPILVVALLGNGLPAFLFAKAQTQISSASAGILNSLVPIFTIFIGYSFYKKNVTKNQIIGVFIGLIGAIMIIIGESKFITTNNYSFLIIIASLFYAINLNTIKFSLKGLSAIEIAGLAFFIIGPICLIMLFFTNTCDKVLYEPKAIKALSYIFILAFFGTSLAVIIFNYLIIKTSALYTSTVTYLIPVIALLWGTLDGEPITWLKVLGLYIIISGLYLINKKNI